MRTVDMFIISFLAEPNHLRLLLHAINRRSPVNDLSILLHNLHLPILLENMNVSILLHYLELLKLLLYDFLPPFPDLKFSDVESIHVVHVWVEASRQAEFRVERLALITREPFSSKVESCRDEFDVGAFTQCVVHYRLVLVYCHGASGIDDVTACFGERVYAVDRAQQELLLQVR